MRLKDEDVRKQGEESADRIGFKVVPIHWDMESQEGLIGQQVHKGFHGASHLYL